MAAPFPRRALRGHVVAEVTLAVDIRGDGLQVLALLPVPLGKDVVDRDHLTVLTGIGDVTGTHALSGTTVLIVP